MNAFDSFYRSKSHVIDIQVETFPLERIGVTQWWIIGFDELSPTGFTEVILFTSLLAVLTEYQLRYIQDIASVLP
jgi:hypothetical protein